MKEGGQLTLLGIEWVLVSIGSIGALFKKLANRFENLEETYNHFLILANTNTLALDDLDVVQSRQNLVLDLELRRHAELGALLDFERLVLESGFRTLFGQVDGDGWAAFRVHGQREDDAVAWIIWV